MTALHVPVAAPAPSLSGAVLIGRNVARLRLAQELDITTLAQRLSRSPAEIEALERGQLEALYLDDLDDVAAALNTSPHALFLPL